MEQTMKRSDGFTLIEVLVVAAILGVLVAALGACLAAGFRVWAESQRCARNEPDVALAAAMMERDVINAFPFYSIPFAGSEDQVRFAGLVEACAPGDGGGTSGVRRISTIRYFPSSDRQLLLRKCWAYPTPEPPDEAAERLVSGLASVVWRYRRDESDSWRSDWTDPSNAPGQVGVIVEVPAMAGYRLERTFVRPVTNRFGGR